MWPTASRGFEKVARSSKNRSPEKEKAPRKQRPSARRRQLRVFRGMAKEKSDEYGKPASPVQAFVAKAEAKHKAAWEKKNPAKRLTQRSSDDHLSSSRTNRTSSVFEQDDYVDACAELKAAERFRAKAKAMEEKMSER